MSLETEPQTAVQVRTLTAPDSWDGQEMIDENGESHFSGRTKTGSDRYM